MPNNVLCFLEIERVQNGETEKDTESYLDLFTTKNIKLKERVLIPVKQYPKVSVIVLFRNMSAVPIYSITCVLLPIWS